MGQLAADLGVEPERQLADAEPDQLVGADCGAAPARSAVRVGRAPPIAAATSAAMTAAGFSRRRYGSAATRPSRPGSRAQQGGEVGRALAGQRQRSRVASPTRPRSRPDRARGLEQRSARRPASAGSGAASAICADQVGAQSRRHHTLTATTRRLTQGAISAGLGSSTMRDLYEVLGVDS